MLIVCAEYELAQIARAVDLQQRSYRLLTWLTDAAESGLIGFETVHAAAEALPDVLLAFLSEHHESIPRTLVPEPADRAAFANVFSSYLATSFDLIAEPAPQRESHFGCYCELCTYLVAGHHLQPKRLYNRDRRRARGLEERWLRALAGEREIAITQEAAAKILGAPLLREPLAMHAYARELLLRLDGHITGPEVLALWRRFAWTIHGSPKPDFTLEAEALFDAQRALVATLSTC